MPRKYSYPSGIPGLTLFQYERPDGFSRWSYRLTLTESSGKKQTIERLLCDNFAYSNHHFGKLSEELPFRVPPPEDFLVYAKRIRDKYAEEIQRTGRILIGEPSLCDVIEAASLPADDYEFISQHIPKERNARYRTRGRVLYEAMNAVIRNDLDLWLNLFGSEEGRARELLRTCLAKAYAEGALNAIPHIL